MPQTENPKEKKFFDYYFSAKKMLKKGLLKRVILEAGKTAKLRPFDNKINFLILKAAQKLKRTDCIIKTCKCILEREPGHTETRIKLARAYFASKDYKNAYTLAREISKISPSPAVSEVIAGCLFTEKKYDEARKIYLSLLQDFYNPRENFMKAAECYHKLGNDRGLLAVIERMLAKIRAPRPAEKNTKKFRAMLMRAKTRLYLKTSEKLGPMHRVFARVFEPFVSEIADVLMEKNEAENYCSNFGRSIYEDKLTGVRNRKFFEEKARPLFYSGERICVIFFDIDGFKQINDVHGHHTGDMVLKLFAGIGREMFEGTLYRFGGDEFMALHMGKKEQAALAAESFREQVGERLTRQLKDGLDMKPLTVSAGIAEYPTEAGSFDEIYKLVDKRMYKAKENGRNRVVCS